MMKTLYLFLITIMAFVFLGGNVNAGATTDWDKVREALNQPDEVKVAELRIPLMSMVQHRSVVVMYEEIAPLKYRININKRILYPKHSDMMGRISGLEGVEAVDWDKEYSFIIEIGRLFEWQDIWDRIVLQLINAD